jgi:hypothetical protein
VLGHEMDRVGQGGRQGEDDRQRHVVTSGWVLRLPFMTSGDSAPFRIPSPITPLLPLQVDRLVLPGSWAEGAWPAQLFASPDWP